MLFSTILVLFSTECMDSTLRNVCANMARCLQTQIRSARFTNVTRRVNEKKVARVCAFTHSAQVSVRNSRRLEMTPTWRPWCSSQRGLFYSSIISNLQQRYHQCHKYTWELHVIHQNALSYQYRTHLGHFYSCGRTKTYQSYIKCTMAYLSNTRGCAELWI